MCYSIRTILPAILVPHLLVSAATAQDPTQYSELVASIEEQIQGQVWLRKSETDEHLVSHVRMGSFAPKGSFGLLKQLPPVTELDASIDPEEVA